jgi:tRNA pseudouridine13 synthase
VGFPNFFGIQRFGKGLRNYKRAVKIFEEDDFDAEKYILRFQLQSRVSMQFNRLLQERIEKNIRYLPGDILLNGNNPYSAQTAIWQTNFIEGFDYAQEKKNHEYMDIFYPDSFSEKINREESMASQWIPSGPLLGQNLLLPPNSSEAFQLEWKLLKEKNFLLHGINVCKHVGIFGVRRAFRVVPQHLEYHYDEDDLIIQFSLPTGAYATALLAELFREIDPKTYE